MKKESKKGVASKKKTIPKKNIRKKDKKQIRKVTNKKVVKTKKIRKIRYGRIFLSLFLFILMIYLLSFFLKFPIRNIYIYNNQILSDQEIIDLAGLRNYPSIFSKTASSIERQLEKNISIKKAIVQKKKLKEIHIQIEENYPLFFDSSKNRTILKSKEETEENVGGPILINYVPDTIYGLLSEKMLVIDYAILNRVSEMKYDPNTVDEERFLFTMNDGNYVYLTLEKFDKINNYVDIIKNFENQKGILYLDSGEYFKIFE